MIKSIRILLVIAAFHAYEIWQMDVKIAFLNGKLEKDVYMIQPEGFVVGTEGIKSKCSGKTKISIVLLLSIPKVHLHF